MIEKVDASREKVRKFGYLFAGVGCVLAAFLWYKENPGWSWAVAGGGLFLVLGLLAYPVLKPVYIGWMMFAFLLGWINTRLLLGLFFVVVLIPAGFLMRLTGHDPLSRKFEPEAKSYWVKKENEERGKERYLRLS